MGEDASDQDRIREENAQCSEPKFESRAMRNELKTQYHTHSSLQSKRGEIINTQRNVSRCR